MICDITNPFPQALSGSKNPGNCRPQHYPQPHTCPRHRQGWPAQYPAASSPWSPPPQTEHEQPETPPHHHRRKTPATTSPPARPDQSSSASTPPWHQTPTPTPPTAEYVHPTCSFVHLSFIDIVVTQSDSVVATLSLGRPRGRQHRHAWSST